MIKHSNLTLNNVGKLKTLAQGAINRNLISLPKELFQCELINILKNAQNALIMVMEKS